METWRRLWQNEARLESVVAMIAVLE
jgi:hypothetical protein